MTSSPLSLAFVVTLLATEFLLIHVLGGALRIAHLLAPVVVLSLLRFAPRIASDRVFWALSGFLSVNALAAAFADSPASAFTSLALLAANMLIAVAVALILVSRRMRPEQLVHIALAVALVGIGVGVIQTAVFQLTGLNLALSESQEAQIASGFSSGLRYEANAFAKNLNVVFLLILPTLLTLNNKPRALLITLVLLLGMLTSLTRSALYGLFITLGIIYVWYFVSGQGRIIRLRVLGVVGLAAVCVLLFTVVVSHFNEYAAHKLTLFFDTSEILGGESSGLRLLSQATLLDSFLSSSKTLLLGSGWGQVHFYLGDIEMQAGGAEIVVALAYGGVLSGLFYCLYQFRAINAARRVAAAAKGTSARATWEGLMFALIGVLVTGQINGALIAPEYWMLFGMAMSCSYQRRLFIHSNRPVTRDVGFMKA
ncbi:MAG: hypothetical protein AB7G75_33625 [Candidatus Binatia bacterium]